MHCALLSTVIELQIKPQWCLIFHMVIARWNLEGRPIANYLAIHIHICKHDYGDVDIPAALIICIEMRWKITSHSHTFTAARLSLGPSRLYLSRRYCRTPDLCSPCSPHELCAAKIRWCVGELTRRQSACRVELQTIQVSGGLFG